MIKKIMAVTTIAASAVGASAAVAPQALADDGGTTSFSGN
ncbi:RdlA protein, partial [Streptomyces sp. SP17KL33]|nr:RdlA protein [Streptomyces sp. SP17KL33]